MPNSNKQKQAAQILSHHRLPTIMTAATTMEESLGVQGTPAIFYVSFMY